MKKVLFMAAIVIPVIFMACGGGTMSPQTFNNTAMKKFEEANKALDEFDAKITEGVKSDNLASITVAAEEAMKKVDTQIEEMKAVKAPQTAEAYKESVLKCLDGVKAIIETGKKYAELKEGYSNSEFNALEKEYNSKRKQLSNDLKTVAKVQAEFAKSVNAKVR